ncbi:MAG: restriction endonuclease subunit M [bacterium]|nr:restriction endonuclease subunit M [Candidatus Minthenecus merdequi]
MVRKSQIKSKERVSLHGEVFTNEREVNAMLDLVKPECLRPDSRFLEPACGDGNFLCAILERKLKEVRRKYKSSVRDYEYYSVITLGSLYGVDIMSDNVEACRRHLFKIWDKQYKSVCKSDCTDETREAIKFIISRNIVCGNALTLMCVDENGNDTDEPIIFSEWSPVMKPMVQRQDFTFEEILRKSQSNETEAKLLNENDLYDPEGHFIARYTTHYKKIQKNG